MQVKYIVYRTDRNSPPKVDIWKTTGEMTHPEYIQVNHINRENVSSQGYLYFVPYKKKWALEHYQMNGSLFAADLADLIQRRRIEKKDRLMVKRKMHQTDFLNDPQLQEETWKDKQKMRALSFRYLLGIQHN